MAITSPIFNMFGRSPLRPLQQHMDKAHACVKAILPFFDSVLKQDWETAETQQATVAQLERDADDMKKDLRLHLPKGLFLPVPRTDILELLSVQDRIANRAKDISGLILGRRMVIPENISQDYMTFLKRCIDASKQARKAINELDELLETGFRGNEVKLVEEMIVKLDEIEHDTDEMQVAVRRQVFAMEKELPPIEAMFLYKIIEWTGDLADRAQTIGGHLQLLLAH